MTSIKWVIALLLAAVGTTAAWADRHDHGRVHFGVTIGPYWGVPWHYPPPPYYYYPPSYYPPLIVERQAPIYIEQPSAPAAAAPQTNYWYYCSTAKGYYPYVKECPTGWQKVLPTPPGQ